MPYMNMRKSSDLAVSDTGTFTNVPMSSPARSEPVTGPKPTPFTLNLPIQ